MKKLAATALLALAMPLPALAQQVSVIGVLAGFAHGPLRVFSGLLSVLLAAQVFSLFLRGGMREMAFLAPALLASGLSELAPTLAAQLLPPRLAAGIEGILFLLAGACVVLFTLELLKAMRAWTLVVLLLLPLAAACIVGIAGGLPAELASRVAMAISYLALAGVSMRTLVRARLRRAGQPFALLLLLVLALSWSVAARLLARPLDPLDFLPALLLGLFASSLLAVELARAQGMYRQTSAELVERIESDWEMIERIREGKELLEKRNIDIMKPVGQAPGERAETGAHPGSAHRLAGGGGDGGVAGRGQGEGHPGLHRRGGHPDHANSTRRSRIRWPRWRPCTSARSSSARP